MMVADNKEKVSGYFYWRQNHRDFEFSLDTLIGTNIVAIDYQNGVATIEADGKQYQDSDPEQLVYRLTGHRMPIKELPNWFLAKLDKRQSMNAQAKYDAKARLMSFRYQGPINTWQISYGNWMTQDRISLPRSINLKSTQNRVKISISDWQIKS